MIFSTQTKEIYYLLSELLNIYDIDILKQIVKYKKEKEDKEKEEEVERKI